MGDVISLVPAVRCARGVEESLSQRPSRPSAASIYNLESTLSLMVRRRLQAVGCKLLASLMSRSFPE